MATQRYISTSFWDDEWVRTLDPSEKFIYLYLMTNTLTNIAGVYKITLARICFDTGYNEDTVKKVLKRFRDNKKAYLENGYMILPTWPKHQKWQTRNKIKYGIEAILKDLDKKTLDFIKKISYRYPIDTLPIPYTYDTNYSDLDSDLDSDLPIEPAAADKSAIVPVKTESALYNKIKTIFEKEQPGQRFTDYGKEGKAIKGLIKKAEGYDHDNPETFIFGMIAQYKELRGYDKFYQRQPFTPSALNSSGIFDRVLNEAKIKWESNQAVSYEEILF